VLQDGLVVVDPSRVAAQIVTGIGFLGAGIIIFRRGSVHGLTTAAAVWESAAIGMAAGAGLLLLAVVVTAMHFLIIVGFYPLAKRLSARLSGSVTMHITYEEGRGVMSQLLQACDPAPVAAHRSGRRRWRAHRRRKFRRDADAVGPEHSCSADRACRHRRRDGNSASSTTSPTSDHRF